MMASRVRIECDHPHSAAGDVLEIDDWLSYEVESDMFTAADAFTMRAAPTGEYLRFFREPGHACRIYYDNNLIMTGIVEATPVNTGPDGPQIELTGRDLGSLLYDDAAPLLDLSNQTLRAILIKLIAAHAGDIKGVITDNSANRYGLTGKRANYSKVSALRKKKVRRKNLKEHKKLIQAAARAAQRTARRTTTIKLYAPYTTEKSFKRTTQPGETIWSVIRRLTRAVGMAAWMTADGYLCCGRPDYQQPAVGQLYVNVDANGNTVDSNCLMSVSPDIGNRYSDYLYLGQGKAHATTAGKDLSELDATARDPSRAFWWDELNRRRQRISTKTARNVGRKKQLTRVARTAMEHAAVKAYNCTATIEGHETTPGGPLWTVDTIVDINYQPKQISAPHYIRRRAFKYDKDSGDTTDLTPMPAGIWLAVDHDKYPDSAYWQHMRPLFARYAL